MKLTLSFHWCQLDKRRFFCVLAASRCLNPDEGTSLHFCLLSHLHSTCSPPVWATGLWSKSLCSHFKVSALSRWRSIWIKWSKWKPLKDGLWRDERRGLTGLQVCAAYAIHVHGGDAVASEKFFADCAWLPWPVGWIPSLLKSKARLWMENMCTYIHTTHTVLMTCQWDCWWNTKHTFEKWWFY